MEENILKMSFDEWLTHRIGYNERGLRALYNRPGSLVGDSVDKVVDIYKRKYKHECDCFASQGLELTYVEWLQVFHNHTPSTFHEMCVNTGMTKKEEDYAVRHLRYKYEDFAMEATNPFK